MKTTFKMFIVFACMLGMASCNGLMENGKEVKPAEEENDKLVRIEFSVDASKTVLIDGSAVEFVAGDAISVFDGSGNRKFTTATSGSKVVFTGEAEDVESYVAVYPYTEGATFSDGAISGICIPAEQTAVAGSFDPKANVSVAYSTKDEKGNPSLHFKNLPALAKIEIPEGVSYAKLTVEGNNIGPDDEIIDESSEIVAGGTVSATPKESDFAYENPSEGAKKVTLNGPIEGGKVYYVALYPVKFEHGLVLRGFNSKGDITAFKKTYNEAQFNRAKVKNFKKLEPTIPVPEPLSGVFSVSPTKKVRFSAGNLQYQASTGHWRFAEKQYIALKDSEKGGNTTKIEDGRKTQDKWIDLFCYGCNGDAYGTIRQVAEKYMPWECYVMASNKHSDGKAYYTAKELLLDNYSDWGYVVSGTEEYALNPWFTLSADEWKYLTGESVDGYTHKKNAGRHIQDQVQPDGSVQKIQNTCIYIRINVGGERDDSALTPEQRDAGKGPQLGVWEGGEFIRGLLLLPDVWVWPTAAGREPVEYYNLPYQICLNQEGEKSTYGTVLNYFFAPNADKKEKAYSEAEFAALEANGAVFLPVTGYRPNTGNEGDTGYLVKGVGEGNNFTEMFGCYWSRSNNMGSGGNYPGVLVFQCGNERPVRCSAQFRKNGETNYRDKGYAVRLVKEYREAAE